MPNSWLLKMIPVATPGHVYSDRDCSSISANSIVEQDGINTEAVPFASNDWDQSTNKITFDSVVVDAASTSGNYLVCICEVKDADVEPAASTCDDYLPVMVGGSPYLSVERDPEALYVCYFSLFFFSCLAQTIFVLVTSCFRSI